MIISPDICDEAKCLLSPDAGKSRNVNRIVDAVSRAGGACGTTCKCRGINEGVVWTNFLATPAAMFYVTKGWYLAGIFVVLSTCASIAYHANREHKAFFLTDALMAAGAFFLTVGPCLQIMDPSQFAIALAIIFVAFWFKGNEGSDHTTPRYDFNHAMYVQLPFSCRFC